MQARNTIIETIAADPQLTVGALMAASEEAASLLLPVLRERRERWLQPILARLPRSAWKSVEQALEESGFSGKELRGALAKALSSTGHGIDEKPVGGLLTGLDAAKAFRDPLGLDKKASDNGQLTPWVRAAALLPLGDLVGIKRDDLLVLASKGLRADQLSPVTLEKAVAEGWLDAKRARRLGLAANLVGWVGEAEAKKLASTRPGGRPLEHLRDFASLSDDDWRKTAAEAGLTQQAAPLRRKLEEVFAAEVLLANLSAQDLGALSSDLDSAATILAKQPDVLLSPQIHADPAVARLQTIVRRFPKLELVGLMTGVGDSESRAQRVVRRIAGLLALRRAGNGQALFELDLRSDSSDMLSLTNDLDPEDAPPVIASLVSYSNLLRVAGDAETATRLLDAGLSTPFEIATTPTKRLRERASLGASVADRIAQAAQHDVAHLAISSGMLFEVSRLGKFIGARGANNVPDETVDYLRHLPELSQLLGNLDYCRCRDCRSILSPAAYFVDLMQFVDEHVLSADYLSATDPYHLRRRRPDLWSLCLECNATVDAIPTLDIVVDILERYVHAGPRAPSGAGICSCAEGRQAQAQRQRAVYGERIACALDGTGPASVLQPVIVPQREVDELLDIVGQSRVDLAVLLGAPKAVWLAAALKTSQLELPVLERDVLDVKRLFGPHADRFASGSEQDRPDASAIASTLRIGHEELVTLLTTRFVRGDSTGVALRTIRTEDALQPDREVVDGLTLEVLGRLHRFVRLWKHAGGEIRSIDLLLGALKDAQDPPLAWNDLLVDGLARFARLLRWRQELDMDWEDLAVLAGPVSTWSSSDELSPFERRFGGLSGPFLHSQAAESATDTEAILTTARVAAGCSTTPEALWSLIMRLRPWLSPASDDLAVPFELSRDNLSLLTRHARTLACLALGLEDLFTLLQMRGLTHLRTVDDFATLIEARRVVQAAELDTATLRWVIEDDASPLPSTAADVVARCVEQQALLFAPSVLALVDGISPELSERIVRASSAFVEHTPTSRFRLADGMGPETPLPIPASLALNPAEEDLLRARASAISDLLRAYWLPEVVPSLLAGPLERSVGEVRQLAALGRVDFADPALLGELLDRTEPVCLRARLGTLARLSRLLRPFDEESLALMVRHPELVGWTASPTVPWSTLEQSVLLSSWLNDGPDTGREARLSVAETFAAGQPLSRLSTAELEAACGATAAVVQAGAAAVGALLGSGAAPIQRIHTLQGWLRASLRLGVDIGALRPLVQAIPFDAPNGALTEYDAMASVAGALRSSLGSRTAEAAVDVQPVDDALRGVKRDALTEYLLVRESDRFPQRSALFHYFLIDTEVQGCARTSCVVGGISALQLFIQRIQMGLEGNGDRRIDPDVIDPDAWAWRKQYRLWEANRKIFLYPENYLVPELRDDKTPLFEQLEEELLGADVTPQRVMDAYATYLSGIEELGQLAVAGSLHELGDQKDVLHLFGVNSEDPPAYYYRRVDNLDRAGRDPQRYGVHWHPWQRLDVKIPVRRVTPALVFGRLNVFWIESTTRSHSDISSGSTQFLGYRHELRLRYASMRLDGTWTPAQSISLDDPAFTAGVGTIEDRLVPPVDSSQDVGSGSARDSLVRAMVATGEVDEAEALDYLRRLPHRSRDVSDRYQLYLRAADYLAGHLDEAARWLAPDILEAFRDDPGPMSGPYVAELDSRLAPIIHGSDTDKPEPHEGYGLQGYLWDRALPDFPDGRFRLDFAGFWFNQRGVDLYRQELGEPLGAWDALVLYFREKPSVLTLDGRRLRSLVKVMVPPYELALGYTAWATIWSTKDRFRQLAQLRDRYDRASWKAIYESHLTPQEPVATLRVGGNLEPCYGADFSAVLEVGSDNLLLAGSPWSGLSYDIHRLGSTLTGTLAETLFCTGIDGLLDTEYQLQLAERPLPVTPATGDTVPSLVDLTKSLDYAGAFGVYYREVFFHIPFALASALHAKGDYAAAQRWLHKLFDPAGAPLPSDDVPLDRVWRYRELRGLGVETLRSKLSDATALAAYESDPFNPYAIARLRLTAFQNAIVMKYLDVLLDWGDSLFSQFTRESVNEATLLYVLVADLLGERPQPVGDCLEGKVETYEDVRETILAAERSLSATTNTTLGTSRKRQGLSSPWMVVVPLAERSGKVEYAGLAGSSTGGGSLSGASRPGQVGPASRESFHQDWARQRSHGTISVTGELELSAGISDVLGRLRSQANGQLIGMARQAGIFCVPPNPKLLAYWDRVDDRLFKIRNCLDIEGNRRSLSLFAPPIEPLLLARMRAAGLSLDDVLSGGPGDVPPYRFSVLMQRAQAAAATLQAVGQALLSALEKRDHEQLAHIRNQHQQNLLRLGQRAVEQELEVAQLGKAMADARLETAKQRRDYLQGLLEQGLIQPEKAQQKLLRVGQVLRSQAVAWELVAGVVHLIPELGAPTALKYGGKQLGDSAALIAAAFRSFANLSDAGSHAVGTQAGFARRAQSWKHELQMAQRAVGQATKEVEVATIRQELAQRHLDSHAESVAQADEIAEFFQEKLTNYGLYEWYATTLTRRYRDAYEAAIAMARLAERAFAFERMDDPTRLSHNYWDPAHRGLLAGERLVADLARLEQRFVETGFRSLEIDQTFPLSQIDPDALWQFKTTGECSFALPERFFDLSYPGHYHRRIKAVRLTIPAVVGPYTSISATLQLIGSRCRVNATDTSLIEMPLQHDARMATSRAQNDGGLFELSFNDPRYLPFEGAGAVSDWTLRLPRTFRAFDYAAIDDVLVHVAYTARHDELLRERQMAEAEALSEAVTKRLGNQPFVRVLSFRHEMGPVLRRLVDAPVGTQIPFTLRPEHLPYYLRGLPLVVRRAALFARGPSSGLTLLLDGTSLSRFSTTSDPGLRGILAHADVTSLLAGAWLGEHHLAIAAAGDASLQDVLLGLELGV